MKIIIINKRFLPEDESIKNKKKNDYKPNLKISSQKKY